MKLPSTILIQENDFHNSWARAVRYVLREGIEITIGDISAPKQIIDICATIELTGNAIRQIEDHELHDQFPFRYIDQYCKEFTRDFHSRYMNLDDEISEFSYLYIDRLVNHPSRLHRQPSIDQMWSMCDHLARSMTMEISSNRNQVITWQPYNDIGNSASPCLQRIWIRYLGDKGVEVHLTWRSRDLYTAWQANIIALVDMMNREVIRPNNCRIVKLVDYADSLHIYESDKDAARRVKIVPTFRM